MAKAPSATTARSRAKLHLSGGKTPTRRKTGQQQDAGDTSKQGEEDAAPKPQHQAEAPAKTSAGDTSKQGAESAAPSGSQVQMIDGVEIEVVAIPSRGGNSKPEKYPFSKLSESVPKGNGFEGPSFFIPEDDNPEKHLAHSRKMVEKNDGIPVYLYHARMWEKDGVTGKRIWKTKNGVKIK